MHSAKNQYAPFEFDGRDDDPDVYDTLASLTRPGYDPGDISVSPIFALITDPKDGDIYESGRAINVAVSVSCARAIDGLHVRIYANDVQIGDVAEAQSRFKWEGVRPGPYDLVAVAEDGEGVEQARSESRWTSWLTEHHLRRWPDGAQVVSRNENLEPAGS